MPYLHRRSGPLHRCVSSDAYDSPLIRRLTGEDVQILHMTPDEVCATDNARADPVVGEENHRAAPK
jgi:hypothetical protein